MITPALFLVFSAVWFGVLAAIDYRRGRPIEAVALVMVGVALDAWLAALLLGGLLLSAVVALAGLTVIAVYVVRSRG